MARFFVPPQKNIWPIPVVLVLLIGVLWGFPHLWYKHDKAGRIAWVHEQTNVAGCKFSSVPVSETAEKLLVADRTFNGDFILADKKVIRVFSAKRFEEKQNEIGLFMHTPDRCWTEVGWQIEAVEPQTVDLQVAGTPVQFERRIFSSASQRELVYFGGLIGGKPLPYRLDHNLSIGARFQSGAQHQAREAALRASDRHFWKRLWDSFASREEVFGPKHFIRVSTPIDGEEVKSADGRLQAFLPQWLVRGDYNAEKEAWKSSVGKETY